MPERESTSTSNDSDTKAGPHHGLGWLRHAPVAWIVVIMMTALLATAVYGASRPQGPRPKPTSSASPTSSYSPVIPSRPVMEAVPAQAGISDAVAAIQADPTMLAGVAITSSGTVEGRHQETWTGGILRAGNAWGTMSVPMALAVLDETKQPEDRDYLFSRAIIDDSAAGDEALWAFLGSGENAATKTTTVLRRYGDYATTVPAASTGTTPPYAQANWRLDAQSQFMAGVSCDYVRAYPVVAKMDDAGPTSYGLATIPNAFTQSGSGLSPNGDLLVRQVGLIQLSPGHEIAVSLAVSSSTGDQMAAQAALTKLADAIMTSATGFVSSSC